tara:strand:- start:192 stop:380 length:189 start_codon:yes stop_codon:yes gene_type:complete
MAIIGSFPFDIHHSGAIIPKVPPAIFRPSIPPSNPGLEYSGPIMSPSAENPFSTRIRKESPS